MVYQQESQENLADILEKINTGELSNADAVNAALPAALALKR